VDRGSRLLGGHRVVRKVGWSRNGIYGGAVSGLGSPLVARALGIMALGPWRSSSWRISSFLWLGHLIYTQRRIVLLRANGSRCEQNGIAPQRGGYVWLHRRPWAPVWE
jgi:hypothetical protein